MLVYRRVIPVSPLSIAYHELFTKLLLVFVNIGPPKTSLLSQTHYGGYYSEANSETYTNTFVFYIYRLIFRSILQVLYMPLSIDVKNVFTFFIV